MVFVTAPADCFCELCILNTSDYQEKINTYHALGGANFKRRDAAGGAQLVGERGQLEAPRVFDKPTGALLPLSTSAGVTLSAVVFMC
jgi:hypothetical protein